MLKKHGLTQHVYFFQVTIFGFVSKPSSDLFLYQDPSSQIYPWL